MYLPFCFATQECVDEMECFVEAARSLNDEFSEAISGDISLITGSYLLIMVYATINLSGRPLLRSRILLSLGALLVSACDSVVDRIGHLQLAR